ncbi:MAG: cytochrome C biogenesis protein, partial [Opitutae bacterium]|nr:cytochrome C biogenesis protein [Opitutae bacterium]
MKKYFPFIVLLLGAAFVFTTLRVPEPPTGSFDLSGFGRLPVLVNGRLKPLDTVARTSLLAMQGRQRVSTPEISQAFVQSPIEWLTDVLFAPNKADTYPVFKIESSEVLDLVGLSAADTKIQYDSSAKRFMAVLGFLPSAKSRFSFNQLQPKLAEIERQAQLAESVESAVRTPFQKQIAHLREVVVLYQRLKHSLQL